MKHAILILSMLLVEGGMTNANVQQARQGNTAPAKKQYLFILKARDTFFQDATEDEKKTMFGHFQHLAGMHKNGVMAMGGRYMTEPIAVLVVEAVDEATARALVEPDPAVKSGILKVEVHEFMMPFLTGRAAPQL